MTAIVPSLDQSSTSRFFWSNSRSFSFAALGFRAGERRLVERVYAFCRITDDLVDEAGDRSPAEITARLDRWLDEARDSYEGREGTGLEWLDELMAESARRGVPFDVVETLVTGVGIDATLTEIKSVEELETYCYGVASVVGVWLCYLFGIREPWFIERAEALGRGMQITNILRDVGEDLKRERIYLPADLLAEFGIGREELYRAADTGRPPPGYDGLIGALIELADRNYDLAWEAIPLLPPSFGRASAVAAEVYRAIHRKVAANGYNNFTVRARTGMPAKVWLMANALLRLYLRRARTGLGRSRILGSSIPLAAAPIIVLL